MRPSSPTRVILVGCGAVARQFYVPALRTLQSAGLVRVSVIIDPQVTAREAVARAFPRAAQAASLDRTTAPVGTLVIVASPPAFHAQQTRLACERGWHVLCEPPMAPTFAECQEMASVAARHNRILAVGFHRRFFSASAYLRTLCRDWLLGPLLSFTIHEGGDYTWPSGPAVFDPAQSRGGVLVEPGAQVLDLIGWWLGEPTELRYADDAMGGLEANAFLQLSFASGVHGRIHLSRDWATAQQYRFVFERGIVTWNGCEANQLALHLAGAPGAIEGALVHPFHEPPALTTPRALESTAQCFLLQLTNVLGAIAGEAPLFVTVDDGAFATRLLEQCYRHRAQVEQPWLSSDELARVPELTRGVPSPA
jgi:predicted dehydrogenase